MNKKSGYEISSFSKTLKIIIHSFISSKAQILEHELYSFEKWFKFEFQHIN